MENYCSLHSDKNKITKNLIENKNYTFSFRCKVLKMFKDVLTRRMEGQIKPENSFENFPSWINKQS